MVALGRDVWLFAYHKQASVQFSCVNCKLEEKIMYLEISQIVTFM